MAVFFIVCLFLVSLFYLYISKSLKEYYLKKKNTFFFVLGYS